MSNTYSIPGGRCLAFVEYSAAGCFVRELDNLLHAATKEPLLKLVRQERVTRQPVGALYLYCSIRTVLRERQLLVRRVLQANPHLAGSLIAAFLGMDPHTVAKGRRELIEKDFEVDRIRKAGGGRKPVEKTPGIISRIEELKRHDTAGDPMSGIKWTRRTTSSISGRRATLGITASKNTVGRLLKKMDFRRIFLPPFSRK